MYAKEGTLTVTCVQADDLKDVQMIGKQDPYVVATLLQPPWPAQERRTRPHNDAGRNPRWEEKQIKNRVLEFDFKGKKDGAQDAQRRRPDGQRECASWAASILRT